MTQTKNSPYSFLISNIFMVIFIVVLMNISVLARTWSAVAAKTSVLNACLSIGIILFALMATTLGLFYLMRSLGKWVYIIGVAGITVVSAASSYFMTVHHLSIGTGVVLGSLTTDTAFHLETVNRYFLLWLVFVAGIPLFYMMKYRTFQTSSSSSPRSLRYWVQTLVVVLLSVGGFKTFDAFERRNQYVGREYIPSPSGQAIYQFVPTNWVVASATLVYQKMAEKLQPPLINPVQAYGLRAPGPNEINSKASDSIGHNPIGLSSSGLSSSAQYVVFVIGETTRSDHLSILGYPRQTTPKLEKIENLFAFRAQSCDTATKASLRCMFVRPESVDDSSIRALTENNLFYTLSSLGWHSELYAMQGEMGFYQKTKADQIKLREEIVGEYKLNQQEAFDDLLTEELKKSIQKNTKGRQLVILHTKGSHHQYNLRYPQRFENFTPVCQGDGPVCSQEDSINGFDNSVLFIDHNLSEIIDALKDKNAIVFYSSDHGESLEGKENFHATPRAIAPAEQFRVPFLVWTSTAWINASPEHQQMAARLKAQSQSKLIFQHQDIFETVLGCLGVTSMKPEGIRAQNNLCSAEYQAKKPTYPIKGPLYD